MFLYNTDGFLRPYKAIEATLNDFEKEFTWNDHRRNLFEQYRAFNEKLKALNPGSFYQWVNGSFVSKKELPGDIDFVIFVDHVRFKSLKSRLVGLQDEFGRWLDFSYASNYPVDHPFHNVTLILKDDYHNLYGSTRQHPLSKLSRPKGYIQINYDNY